MTGGGGACCARRCASAATVALLLILVAAAPAAEPDLPQAQHAQAADLAAQQAAQAQEQLADQEAQRLAEARVAAAARLLATETALAEAEQRVQTLAKRRDAAEVQLAADSRAFAPLLPLLQRLSLFPAETLLATPGSPEDAVRGVLVLGGLVRQLHARAAHVSAERETVLGLQAQLDAALPVLRAAEQGQRLQSAALDAALTQTRASSTAAQLQTEIAARRAATDAARADTLRHAIVVLEADRAAAARRRARAARVAAPPATPPPVIQAAVTPPAVAGGSVAVGRGGWAMPAAGRIVRGFGAPGDAGPASGMTVQTPPGARVVSPCGGRVEFAAPFRSYGLLVIVACGGDIHVVLSGLDRLDVASGQALQAGEPVGIMSPSGVGGLYLELRRGGDAVDPAPYLRTGL